MTKVLVVDDVAIIRDPIAASLRLAGFETLCAGDGEEALTLTRIHRPDVILLDVSMPKMNGLAFLKILRAEPAIAHTRVILLTAMSEKKYIVAAMSMGVRDYMLKSRFRLADLLERIKKPSVLEPPSTATTPATPVPVPQSTPATASVVAPPSPRSEKGAIAAATPDDSEIPRLLTRERFLARVTQVFEAKTLSGVVAQVIALASSPRGEMAQLASLIAQDPMLAVRVLQAANSSAYATGVAVTNIPEAIRKLGFTTVRNVAAALGVFDCMPEVSADGFDPIRCWQHSFAVAQLCERLATTTVPEQSGLAYVVGLCHDLGDIFVRTQFTTEYQQVTEAAARTRRSRDELHWLMLGMTMPQMISEVLKSISLPAAIREPIEILHSSKRSSTPNALARILSIAENLANSALIASSPNAEVKVLTQTQCKAALGVGNPPPPDAGLLRSQVLSLTITLARLSRADEAKLLVPMFATGSARLWIARAAGVSSSDPISLALTSLAECTFEKRLPELAEFGGFDGLIVLSPSPNIPGFVAHDVEALVTKAAEVGRTLSTLCISAGAIAPDEPGSGLHWRETISLAELSNFIEELSKAHDSKVAA